VPRFIYLLNDFLFFVYIYNDFLSLVQPGGLNDE